MEYPISEYRSGYSPVMQVPHQSNYDIIAKVAVPSNNVQHSSLLSQLFILHKTIRHRTIRNVTIFSIAFDIPTHPCKKYTKFTSAPLQLKAIIVRT